MSFRTVDTVARQRGRAPQLPFIMSSTSSAVVLGSTLTGLSCGAGGNVTLAHSLVMSCVPGLDMARYISHSHARSAIVARIERSEIRVRYLVAKPVPGFASLKPGDALLPSIPVLD